MKGFVPLLSILVVLGIAGCGNYSSSMPGANQTPVVTGTWNAVFAQSTSTPAQSTVMTISFNQNGNVLTGTVTAITNPSGSCFPTTVSGSSFNVTGQVSSASTSNLNLSIAFSSGSLTGTAMETGSLGYLSAMANGTFTFSSGAPGCSGGTFTLTKIA